MSETQEQEAAQQQGLSEQEPLLGRVGDASQQVDKPMYYNLVLGTAIIAQGGVWLLVGVIWGSILSKDIQLFSAHPLLNSAGLLLITQAILLLQPTHTASQKRVGAYVHSGLNFVGLLALMGGLAAIVYNKELHHGAHFQSVHARLGLTVYILFAVQALIGAAAFYTPALFGGVQKAKATYKYHRMSGYLVVVLSLAAVASATQTPFNQNALHIRLWAVIVTSLILLVGVLPRIKKQKLGL